MKIAVAEYDPAGGPDQTGSVRKATPQEAAELTSSRRRSDTEIWQSVRSERDRLLSSSDWTQLADAPVDTVAWAHYRQALRDLPQTCEAVAKVVWPAAPLR